ncbi:MAG: class I SAM-dependent rRNA methyltransferase [Phycisphaerales bacterium]|nr:class I SAM-dependent rRNA methyltransferase [Phycisphaerales bacterium]
MTQPRFGNRGPRRPPRPMRDDDAGGGPPPAGAISPWVQLRSGSMNPLIFKRMIRTADPAARSGDVVHVYDKSGAFFGRALYHADSQIALRMLTFRDEPVDAEFWRQRLASAVELRRRLRLDDVTDAYRLVHAEGDGLSGLVIERIADRLVFEVFSKGMFQRAHELAAILAAELGPPSSLDRPGRAGDRWRVLVRADRRIQRIEGFQIASTGPRRAEPPTRGHGDDDDDAAGGLAFFAGDAPGALRPVGESPVPGAAPVPDAGAAAPGAAAARAAADAAPESLTIREHGVRYRVDVARGHKTGFFCDQRDNRLRLATLCRDASVLDVCCYTGGFALAARKLGGAKEVTAVDLDEAAIAMARDNANLNQVRIDFVHADAFAFLRQMIANGRRFDTVVLDPPKFAPTRDDVDEALGKYYDLNTLGAQLVRPGGVLLTCSCSGLVSRGMFHETVHRALRRVGRPAQMFDYTGAGPDHPVMSNCPESEYLKALWLRIL